MSRTVRWTPLAQDPHTGARRGRLHTPHGTVETPTFMPVGTAGTVKAMLPDEVASTGAEVILGNTFHLYLRPGHEVVRKLGGLHGFAQWDRTILTDSGGFQVFSLAELRTIREEGVEFRSPYDGSKHTLTPESSVQIQEALGSDIAMAFDECPPHDADRPYVERSMARTTRWLDRCVAARQSPERTSLFGIVQGGRYDELRAAHAAELAERDLDGYAIGGVAVGESPEEMYRVTRLTAPLLPADKPRYLMGVGYPHDLVEAVAAGVDMFDCVIPTRNARNGRLFVAGGHVSAKQSAWKADAQPIEPGCGCPTCARFSRAYIRHLFMANEILGHRLMTMHNLWHYQWHMQRIRAAIEAGTMAQLLEATRRERAASDGARAASDGA